MKKYMLSFMLTSASCALPIMAMEFADEQTKKNYEAYLQYEKTQPYYETLSKFLTNHASLKEFEAIIVSESVSAEKKVAAYKKYFDKLINVAIEDRNYFIEHTSLFINDSSVSDKENIPFSILRNVTSFFIHHPSIIDCFTYQKLWEFSNLDDSDIQYETNKLDAEIKSLEELRQKGLAAIEKIKNMKKEGKYTPNPEYHALKTPLKPAHGLSLATYACIAGGIALGAAAIVGIGYWIKKQFFDKNKKTVQTNKPHIAS